MNTQASSFYLLRFVGHSLLFYGVVEEAEPTAAWGDPITRCAEPLQRSRTPASTRRETSELGGYHGWIAVSIAFPSQITADPGTGFHETRSGKAFEAENPPLSGKMML